MPNKKYILIAEDDEDDQLLLKSAFEENDFKLEIVFKNDGQALMDHLNEQQFLPELILLDLNLPKIDGREILQNLSNSPNLKHIPRLIISTSSAEEEIKKAYALGAAAYLVKPASYSALLALVKNLIAFYFYTARLR